MYGITETTVHVTYRRPSTPEVRGAAAAGRPRRCPSWQVYVLDARRRAGAVGVAGEIYVGGAGVARGYLDRPELTAQRFVPDPFGRAGTRLYRSGDLARLPPDGGLEHLGRLDSQVKMRGYRIELGEIEAAAGRAPGVRGRAVVLPHEPAPRRPPGSTPTSCRRRSAPASAQRGRWAGCCPTTWCRARSRRCPPCR